jgi:cysteinyl-tRNA synthetase
MNADMDRTNDLSNRARPFARAVLNFKMKFLEMMDDDFTPPAGSRFARAGGEINAFIEKHTIEQNKQPELIAAVAAATQSLQKARPVLGLFRPGFAKPATKIPADRAAHDALIDIRATARKDKNFPSPTPCARAWKPSASRWKTARTARSGGRNRFSLYQPPVTGGKMRR